MSNNMIDISRMVYISNELEYISIDILDYQNIATDILINNKSITKLNGVELEIKEYNYKDNILYIIPIDNELYNNLSNDKQIMIDEYDELAKNYRNNNINKKEIIYFKTNKLQDIDNMYNSN